MAKPKKKEQKKHFFSVNVANEMGVIPALLLEYIEYWIGQNSINKSEETFKDEKYWTFGSVSYIQQKHFPYLTTKQVRTGIDKLIEEGLVEVGNYNKKAYDKTKWYTLTDKGRYLVEAKDPINSGEVWGDPPESGVREY